MRFTLTAFVLLAAIAVATAQTPAAIAPIRIRGCIQGDGSDERPWLISGAVLPAPPAAAPAGGGRGGGGGGGAGAGAAGGRGGGAPGAGAAPAGGVAGGRGAAPAGGGAAPAGGAAAGGGGRGAGAPAGGGGRGAGAAPAAAAPAPPAPMVDLRLTGVDMAPWRGMRVELEGLLGARPAGGLQEFRVVNARSAWGDCPVRR